MSILVANIGTSDIAIKVGDYYLPIGFDRSEPNLEEPDPDTPEGVAWRERQMLVDKQLQADLNIAPRTKYRDACEAILSAYRADPETWHPRISIGRLQGVINSVLEAEAKVQQSQSTTTAYLIVTDQPKTEVRGYPTDTIYAFDIIQAWLSRQRPALVSGESAPLKLVPNTIRVPAIHEDLLHEHYYQLFQTFTPDDIIYLSVKGGTYQMQQALKVQALASNTKAQIFLSPKPQVNKILVGQPSDCQRIAYWRYQQNQKYQTVQLLLDRWDFDGAAVLLENWEATLQALVTDDQATLQDHQVKVTQATRGLQMAVAHLNLDSQAADGLAGNHRELLALLGKFSSLENLYAQCKIYAELKQISHFLSRLGSFYEATQNDLIEKLGGLQYLDTQKRGPWEIQVKALETGAPDLWQLLGRTFKWRSPADYPEAFGLRDRFKKRSFIKTLIEYAYGNLPSNQPLSLNHWKKLDFWYDIRNQLMHGAKGINEDRLEAVYQQREAKHQIACPYGDILPTMAAILTDLSQISSAAEASPAWQDPGYGLYEQIRHWAIATLKS